MTDQPNSQGRYAELVDIWVAAYAAAFVADFDRRLENGADVDRAIASLSAERPWHLADLAVSRYSEWLKDEIEEEQ